MVNFIFVDIPEFNFNKNIFSQWITSSIKEEGKIAGDIVYHFCSDEKILAINKTYLDHDTYTDIISFPTSNNEKIISGEIFISVDRIKENANKYDIEFYQEFKRVLIHGVLHFIGYDDHKDQDILTMRSKEDYYLNLHPHS
jgi:probable rRNA maturation factor